MGRKRHRTGRQVNGILLLDKPVGITSNTALQRIKRIYRARKAGHTGSLDKLASGMLPICLGESTKFANYLLNSDKKYLATCRLGTKTTTGDLAGEIIETRQVPELSVQNIESVLSKFRGTILQIPPMFSALKQNGIRLYQLAYQGQEVKREAREIQINKLELLDFTPDSIKIEVLCSKGTYIRALAEDIGNSLGCGAYVSQLRRIGAGCFVEDQMVTLETLEESDSAALDAYLLPVDSMLKHLVSIELTEAVTANLYHGQPVCVDTPPAGAIVTLYSRDRQFLGLGKVREDGRIIPKRLMQPEIQDTYR